FILTRQNQTWVGIGYCVRVADPMTGALYPAQLGAGQGGVGSLYRFSETMPVLAPVSGVAPGNRTYPAAGRATDPNWLYQDFLFASQSGSRAISNRICDGIVHFHVRSFATNGFPLYAVTATTAPVFRTNVNLVSYSTFKQAGTVYSTRFPDNVERLY